MRWSRMLSVCRDLAGSAVQALLSAAFLLPLVVFAALVGRILLRNATWARRVASEAESGNFAELRRADTIASEEWPEDGTIPRLVFRYSKRTSNVSSEVGFVVAGRVFLLTTGTKQNPAVVRTFSRSEGARFVPRTDLRYFPYLEEVVSGSTIRCSSSNELEAVVAALTAEGLIDT